MGGRTLSVRVEWEDKMGGRSVGVRETSGEVAGLMYGREGSLSNFKVGGVVACESGVRKSMGGL